MKGLDNKTAPVIIVATRIFKNGAKNDVIFAIATTMKATSAAI